MHLEKKRLMKLVLWTDPLAFHFIRPLWALGKRVSPKQSVLQRVGINHLLGVCGRCDIEGPDPLSVEEPPERGVEVDTDEYMLESFALAQDFRICNAHFSALLLLSPHLKILPWARTLELVPTHPLIGFQQPGTYRKHLESPSGKGP